VFQIEELDLHEDSVITILGELASGEQYVLAEITNDDADTVPARVYSTDSKAYIQYQTGPGPHWSNKGFKINYELVRPEGMYTLTFLSSFFSTTVG